MTTIFEACRSRKGSGIVLPHYSYGPNPFMVNLARGRPAVVRARHALEAARALGVTGLWPGAILLPYAQITVARDGGRIYLKEFWVSPDRRGIGEGQRILSQLAEIADAFRVPIVVWVMPYGGKDKMGVRALTDWYSRNGFETTEGRWMLRRPQDDATARSSEHRARSAQRGRTTDGAPSPARVRGAAASGR